MPADTKVAPVPYRIKTALQAIICQYKECLGIPIDDREWDREQFAIWTRAGLKLLRAFPGNPDESRRAAMAWLVEFAGRMAVKSLTWNLATAAKFAWDEKGKRDDDNSKTV